MRFYIINGYVTRKKLNDRSHCAYLMGYADTKIVILYWKPDQYFLSTDPIMFGLMNIILVSPKKISTLQVIYSFNKILTVIFIVHISST